MEQYTQYAQHKATGGLYMTYSKSMMKVNGQWVEAISYYPANPDQLPKGVLYVREQQQFLERFRLLSPEVFRTLLQQPPALFEPTPVLLPIPDSPIDPIA